MSKALNYKDIKRKNSNISPMRKLHSFVNNLEWGNGYLSRNTDIAKGYFWTCLSAIGDDVGAQITEQVINYIDNVSNIETCEIRALQSICKTYGIDYSILNTEHTPLEVLKLMDVLSMNKTYLLDTEHSRLISSVREQFELSVTYDFDYYNSEFYNAEYVDGDILISLSGASSATKNQDRYNSYLLFRDQKYVDNPETLQERISDYISEGEFSEEMLSDDLSSDRFSQGYYKMFADTSRLKIYPTWLSDYTFEYITMYELSVGLSSFYDLQVDRRLQIKPRRVVYPSNPLERLSVIEDYYEYTGCLSTIIQRVDETSDKIQLERMFKGKKTGNNLYYVSFTPTRSSTLVNFRKYTYNNPIHFWIVMNSDNSKILASSNSRVDITSKNGTFYIPMLLDGQWYVYNGVRISPDEFIDDVFLQSSIYFFGLWMEDGKWKYDLKQEPEINLYNLGVVNVYSQFYPYTDVTRNTHTTVGEQNHRDFYKYLYYTLLSSMCNMRYTGTNIETPVIYENLGADKLTLAALMNIEKNTTDDIVNAKLQNKVPLRFDEVKAVNNIDSGISSFEDFTENEVTVLEKEIQRRASAMVSTQNVTRCFYYREAKVKEYFKYIQQILTDSEWQLSNQQAYDVESGYLLITDNSTLDDNILAENVMVDGVQETVLHDDRLWECAEILTDMTLKISEIRERLKTTAQKYYMRGTYELLAYSINEYLLNNIKIAYDELSAYQSKFADVQIVEYVDNTEYFNIKQNLEKYSRIKYKDYENNRYFEDTLFQQLYLKNYATEMYDRSMMNPSEISGFYNKVHKLDMSTNDKTKDFLDTVYNTGATFSHIDADTNTIAHSTDSDSGMVWDDKTEALDLLYSMYTGNEFGNDPVYNAKNRTYGSYQIHPFLYNFVEYADMVLPIENYYHKYMPEDYEETIAKNIDKQLGMFGQITNQWLTDTFDFSGYAGNFEIGTNGSATNPNRVSQFSDRDGMFNEEFITQQFGVSQGTNLTMQKDTLASDVSPDYGNEILDYVTHLKISDDEKQLIYDRFAYYYLLIKDIVVDNCEYYDIFKFTQDVNGNQIFLVKRYPQAVDDTPIEERRNTRGTLWVRIKDQPCAFPAFNINVNDSLQNKTLRHRLTSTTNIYNLILTEINSVLYTESDTNINAELKTDFLGGFYDMEMDPTNHFLLLTYTPQNIINHTDVHTYRNVSVMIGKILKTYNYTKCMYEYSYSMDLSKYVGTIANGNLREKTSDYSYTEFLGFLHYDDSIGACFARKYVDPELKTDTLKQNFHWKNNIIKVNNDFAPYTITYEIMVEVRLFDYTTNICVYNSVISDIKYNIATDNHICMAQSGEKILIAFESDEITNNSLVTNYSEFDYNDYLNSENILLSVYDGSISAHTELSNLTKHQIVNWPYVTIDYNLDGDSGLNTVLKNTFDSFDKYIVTLEFEFEHEELEYSKTTYYNIGSDMSFMPIYPSNSGIERVWNNAELSSHDEINLQPLGYSSTYYPYGEDGFYTGIYSLDQQNEALQSYSRANKRFACYENPFPYVVKVGADSNGIVSTDFPFDLTERLVITSIDANVQAVLVKYGDALRIKITDVYSIPLSSADIIITKTELDTLVGPFSYPRNPIESSVYPIREQLKYDSMSFTYENDCYKINGTSATIDTVISCLQTYKMDIYGMQINGDDAYRYRIGQYTLDNSQISTICSETGIVTPQITIVVSEEEGVMTAVLYQNGSRYHTLSGDMSIIDDMVTRIPSKITRTVQADDETPNETLLIWVYRDYDGNFVYNDAKSTIPISEYLQYGDTVEIYGYEYYGGMAEGYAIPLSSVLFNKTTTMKQVCIELMNGRFYRSNDKFTTITQTESDINDILRYRRGIFPCYTTSMTENLQMYNKIVDGNSNLFGYIYGNSTFDDESTSKMYAINEITTVMCGSNGVYVNKTGVDGWSVVTDQVTDGSQVLNNEDYSLIVKTSDGINYCGNLTEGTTQLTKVQHIPESQRETYVISVDGEISSYALTLRNSSNNQILVRRERYSGVYANNYKYCGDTNSAYDYNDGTSSEKSFSINNIREISCFESGNELSLVIFYHHEEQQVEAGTMNVQLERTDGSIYSIEDLHVMPLTPMTTVEFKAQLLSVQEDTQISDIGMFRNGEVAFKYPSNALNTHEQYPSL